MKIWAAAVSESTRTDWVDLITLMASGAAIALAIWAISETRREGRASRSEAVISNFFTQHWSQQHSEAREIVYRRLPPLEELAANGLQAFEPDDAVLVKDLMFFYDNLGVFLHEKLVPAEPVVGYLGGSVIDVWQRLHPLVKREREIRNEVNPTDPDRWMFYFEEFDATARRIGPVEARRRN